TDTLFLGARALLLHYHPTAIPQTTVMMEANPPAPTPDEIASVAGPFLMGVVMTWFLLGVYMMQAHFYFLTYNDGSIIRGLVITISALEVAQLIFSTSNAWYYLIKTWGNFSGFSIVPREATVLVLLCGISSMIVQTFYVWRIWFLSYSY
ncbi:hypothetical protein B0H17DRAFT_1107543, partial [Mycena rosella]